MKNKFVNKEVVVSGVSKIKFELEKEHYTFAQNILLH